MSDYSASNELGGTKQAVSTSYKTLLSITAEATPGPAVSGKIFDIAFGTIGTPADNTMEWDISKQTAAGTATAVTPTTLDGSNGVARLVAEANYTAEGTITANSSVFYLPVNQRASYRFAFNPGSELVIPATDENGLACRVKSATGYTGTAGWQAYFRE